MVQKIKALLGSLRFWVVTLGWAAAFFALIETQGFSWQLLFDQVRNWFLTVAGIGTVDRLAETLGPKTPASPPQ